MRRDFFAILPDLMASHDNLYALTGDLGFGGFDKVREQFPSRFINCGAAEQAMLDMACGLALSEKIPIVYSITPFLLYRGFETLRTYVNHEGIPIKLIGSGRDKDYAHDGFSHDASDAKPILDTLPNIEQYYPQSVKEMLGLFPDILTNGKPVFLSLKR